MRQNGLFVTLERSSIFDLLFISISCSFVRRFLLISYLESFTGDEDWNFAVHFACFSGEKHTARYAPSLVCMVMSK